MDWSSVYENSGEERGNWEDYGETRSSRNAHRLLHRQPSSLSLVKQQQDASSAQYSPAVAYAFTVNYILGVGSLGIPYAFYRAGLVLGNFMIVLVTLVSYVTVMWVCFAIGPHVRRASWLQSSVCQYVLDASGSSGQLAALEWPCSCGLRLYCAATVVHGPDGADLRPVDHVCRPLRSVADHDWQCNLCNVWRSIRWWSGAERHGKRAVSTVYQYLLARGLERVRGHVQHRRVFAIVPAFGARIIGPTWLKEAGKGKRHFRQVYMGKKRVHVACANMAEAFVDGCRSIPRSGYFECIPSHFRDAR
uniref:Amino acid transporter transmembrane domain-containing protein n=1 Tax=Hyaloperonospora arabidopsidis (strain Emoy2) TaxID=559515 RepID=M4C2B9_HYAAE